MKLHIQDSRNKLILWDIDGTLLHCGADGTKALNQTFQELYGVENAFTKVGIGSAMDSVILDRIMEAFQLDKNDLEKVKNTYRGILTEVLDRNEAKRILPGIRELLDHIKDSTDKFNALLTSNLRIGAEIKLTALGLADYFQVGGFGDQYGEKWHAAERGIAEAEEYFGVSFSKENIYLIGDSAYDIECAKKMGFVSVGVATGWMSYEELKSHEPDHLYVDLSDWRSFASVLEGDKAEGTDTLDDMETKKEIKK